MTLFHYAISFLLHFYHFHYFHWYIFAIILIFIGFFFIILWYISFLYFISHWYLFSSIFHYSHIFTLASLYIIFIRAIFSAILADISVAAFAVLPWSLHITISHFHYARHIYAAILSITAITPLLARISWLKMAELLSFIEAFFISFHATPHWYCRLFYSLLLTLCWFADRLLHWYFDYLLVFSFFRQYFHYFLYCIIFSLPLYFHVSFIFIIFINHYWYFIEEAFHYLAFHSFSYIISFSSLLFILLPFRHEIAEYLAIFSFFFYWYRHFASFHYFDAITLYFLLSFDYFHFHLLLSWAITYLFSPHSHWAFISGFHFLRIYFIDI